MRVLKPKPCVDQTCSPATLPYKVICVSFYHEDLAALDTLVADLRKRGWSSMNRSRLLRYLIRSADTATFDIDKMRETR